MAYPILDESPLQPTPRKGIFGLRRRRRDGTEVPKAGAHHALVWRVGGEFVLDFGGLSAVDDQVVDATHVSVVDMRIEAPVTVHLPIPSADMSEFGMRVTFRCTVTDAVLVVRHGVDAAEQLRTYLQSHRRIFELGLDHPVDEVTTVRRDVNAQVRAFVTVRPPRLPGLVVYLASVEVLTPVELMDSERRRRGRRTEHLLSSETSLGEFELAAQRLRQEQALQYTAQQGDQQMAADQQEHHMRMVAAANSFRREQVLESEAMLGDDPVRALHVSFATGELGSVAYTEQLRAERDREREYARQVSADNRDERTAESDRRWTDRQREREYEFKHEELRRADEQRRLAWAREDEREHAAALREDDQKRLEAKVNLLRDFVRSGHMDMRNVESLIDGLIPAVAAVGSTPHEAPARGDELPADIGAEVREEDDAN